MCKSHLNFIDNDYDVQLYMGQVSIKVHKCQLSRQIVIILCPCKYYLRAC